MNVLINTYSLIKHLPICLPWIFIGIGTTPINMIFLWANIVSMKSKCKNVKIWDKNWSENILPHSFTTRKTHSMSPLQASHFFTHSSSAWGAKNRIIETFTWKTWENEFWTYTFIHTFKLLFSFFSHLHLLLHLS